MSNSKVGGYVLLVRFRTKDGQQQAFASAMQSAVPATRLEPDNRQYEFYSDQEDPLNFMLYEEYTDEAALQQHRARPEMAKTVAAIQPMLENPPEMSTWTQSLTNARNDDGNRDRGQWQGSSDDPHRSDGLWRHDRRRSEPGLEHPAKPEGQSAPERAAQQDCHQRPLRDHGLGGRKVDAVVELHLA